MTWADRAAEISNGLIIGGFMSVGSAIVWFLRWVFGISAQSKKNEAELALLRQEIATRDTQRNEDREDLKEVKDSVNVITQHLLNTKR